MALDLLLSVHGGVCRHLIKLFSPGQRERVHFPLPGSMVREFYRVCWSEEDLGLFPVLLLWGCSVARTACGLCHDQVVL